MTLSERGWRKGDYGPRGSCGRPWIVYPPANESKRRMVKEKILYWSGGEKFFFG